MYSTLRMPLGGPPQESGRFLVEPFSELRDPILIICFSKKSRWLEKNDIIFLDFLDQRGPSIQSDLDKRVAIFDTKNILDKRPTSDA